MISEEEAKGVGFMSEAPPNEHATIQEVAAYLNHHGFRNMAKRIEKEIEARGGLVFDPDPVTLDDCFTPEELRELQGDTLTEEPCT